MGRLLAQQKHSPAQMPPFLVPESSEPEPSSFHNLRPKSSLLQQGRRLLFLLTKYHSSPCDSNAF